MTVQACPHCNVPLGQGKPHASNCPNKAADEIRAVATRPAIEMAVTDRGMKLDTYADARAFAQTVVDAGLAPKGMNRPEQVMIAVQAGAELGFSPMRALACMKVINGRAGPMANPAKALVLSQGALRTGTKIREWMEVDGTELDQLPASVNLKDVICYCESYRSGENEPTRHSFSWIDAIRANQTGKQTYKEYPQRMLRARALDHHLSDTYPDVMMGMHLAEVLDDLPALSIPSAVEPLPPQEDPLLADPNPLPPGRSFEEQRDDMLPSDVEPEADIPVPSLDDDSWSVCPRCERHRDLISSNGHGEGCQ